MRLTAWKALALSFLLALALPARAAEGPSATVERLNSALLEVMKNAEALGYQGRYDQLAPALKEIFDFPVMARASLGGHWRKTEPDKQEAFVAAFTDYSIAIFASRFDGYSGERFEILGEQEGKRGTVLVRNQIVKSDGEAVAINYLARPDDAGDWRLVDSVLDAKYSELATRRSEYSGIVKGQGIDALIKTLNDKAASYDKP